MGAAEARGVDGVDISTPGGSAGSGSSTIDARAGEPIDSDVDHVEAKRAAASGDGGSRGGGAPSSLKGVGLKGVVNGRWEHTNHAVLVVGWGTELQSGRKFWIAMNTWGEGCALAEMPTTARLCYAHPDAAPAPTVNT